MCIMKRRDSQSAVSDLVIIFKLLKILQQVPSTPGSLFDLTKHILTACSTLVAYRRRCRGGKGEKEGIVVTQALVHNEFMYMPILPINEWRDEAHPPNQ